MSQIFSDKLFYEKQLSYKIIGAAFDVHKELGSGFLEKVYENALTLRFEEIGLNFEVQKQLHVYFHNKIVGHYVADVIVENKILIELKTVKIINEIHMAQLINYLKATKLKIGYILILILGT